MFDACLPVNPLFFLSPSSFLFPPAPSHMTVWLGSWLAGYLVRKTVQPQMQCTTAFRAIMCDKK